MIRVVVVLWCGDKTLSGGGWLRYGKKVSQAYPQPRRGCLAPPTYSPFHSFIAFPFCMRLRRAFDYEKNCILTTSNYQARYSDGRKLCYGSTDDHPHQNLQKRPP